MKKSIFYKVGLFGLLVFLVFSCKKEEAEKSNNLSFVSLKPVAVLEASGLANYKNGQIITVSDSLSVVYILSSGGEVLKTLNYIGKNLEGVAYDPSAECIYVVEEKNSEVVMLDTNGLEIDRFVVPLDNQDPKHGLEGISFNSNNNHLYVISEKFPSLLFELERDGTLIDSYEMNFAEDYSSVYFDPESDLLWILSDDSKTLTQTTLQGIPIITYNTGVKKGEGVIVDSKNSTVYIITDSDSALYTLSFSN